MAQFWWLMVALLATASAKDEIIEASKNPEFSVYVDRWNECDPKGLGEHGAAAVAAQRSKEEDSESLVYTPKLGVQQRQIECRNYEGKYVEPIYCGTNITNITRTRMCILREDCLLGEWFPWRPKPDGSLVRNRRVIRLPQGGGRDCGLVEEIRPATIDESAHWSAGAWGPCRVATDTSIAPLPVIDNDDDDGEDNDAIYDDDEDDADDNEGESVSSCGGGMQRREATCVRADGRTLHATQCAHTPMPALVQPCEVPCPRDCQVGEWSEWGACQPTDGCPLFPVQQLTTTGYSVRRRRVISAASGGGAPCPPLEEKRTCSTPRCASWQALPWGPCVLSQAHTQCGPGKRTRELRCVGHDGKEAQRAWCSGSGAPARSERCRIACAGDCVVSAWTSWGACSAPCAAHARPRPRRTRTRHVLAHAAPDGWPCPPDSQLSQNESCNTHACSTYSWLATPWGPCGRKHQDYMPANNYTDLQEGEPFNKSDDEEPCVEEGEMIRDVMCVQDNADVVREALCAPLKRPASRRACTVRCHRGCKVESWMPWTPCPNSCEPAKQSRVRVVHGGPSCGPKQEIRECPLPASCGPRAARWVAGAWAACRLPPTQRCGPGYSVRSLWCGTTNHRVEAGACVDQPVPQTVSRCHVSCDATPPPPPACEQICKSPMKYLDATNPDVPDCSCPQTSVVILPSDSDCILPPGMECGEGRVLRTAKCLYLQYEVPMDVCRKFHPLSGPLRISVPSTDGYTYDEQFPALLRGPCWVRCARDCAVGPWAPWGPCAPEPGTRAAFRFRSREVIQGGSAGGRECGATLQRATCNVAAPRWDIGEWSVCTPRHALCGHAIVNRTVKCLDEEGKAVDASVCEASGAGPTPAADTTCRAPCPADCVVSAWSEWSPCEQTRWGGRRDRTRVVLRGAAEGGVSCPQLVAAEPCDPLSYSWHVAPWDDCQPLGGSPCGEGTKKRAVRCLRSDGVFVNDSYCPNTTSTESESWCYVPCGVDCEVSEWSEWDTSACSCGMNDPLSHMRRTREQLTASVWPGRGCPPTEQRIPCPQKPCLRLVSHSTMMCHLETNPGESVTDPSTSLCGVGNKMYNSRCEIVQDDNVNLPFTNMEPWRCTNHLPGRIMMPALPLQISEETCTILCTCVFTSEVRAGPWGEWGPCHLGSRSRSRQVHSRTRESCPVPSKVVTIEWTNCTDEVNKQELSKLDFARQVEKQRRAYEREIFHNGYIEGSKSLLIVVWAATVVLVGYGCYALYVFTIRFIRSRRSKCVTKV